MTKYILDTNVYIQARDNYYHPEIAPNYWDILKKLGAEAIIQSPKQVSDELHGDWFKEWKKINLIFIKGGLPGIEPFFENVREKYFFVKEKIIQDFRNQFSRRGRPYTPPKGESVSDADMFVMATTLFFQHNNPDDDFVLVTKENDNSLPSKPVKIPHVCLKLGIEYIDDFEFIKRMKIIFDAKIKETG